MEKRKVLFVIHQLNHGGVQKSLIAALNALNYEENEVTLYIRKNRVQLLDEVNSNVQKIIINEDQTHYYRKQYMIYLSVCKKINGLLGNKQKCNDIQSKIVSYLNESQMKYEQEHYFSVKEEYDVAVSYIQGYTAKFVAEHINAKKKIMFFHGSTDENHELHEEIMPKFDDIAGVNENVQKILEQLYPSVADKMTYIENYVDAEEIREKAKAFNVEKEQNKLILCSCGRITPVKGFDLAVETAKELHNAGIDFLWYFVGDGSERKKIESLIEQYYLKNNIVITGMQENPYPYIASCDIYVQPSYEEAQPLSIIEAMILNKTVISTATVGGKTLITEGVNGILSEIKAEAVSEAISYVMNNKEI